MSMARTTLDKDTTTTRRPRGAAAKAATAKKATPTPKATPKKATPTPKATPKATPKKATPKATAQPAPKEPTFLEIDTNDGQVVLTIKQVHERLNKRQAVPNSQVRILVRALELARGMEPTPQR